MHKLEQYKKIFGLLLFLSLSLISSVLYAGNTCTIGGHVYQSGAASGCGVCQPSVSATSLTVLSDGTSCGSGKICSKGSCMSGCYVGGKFYSSGATITPCFTCQPWESTTLSWYAGDGTSCGKGELCFAGIGCAELCYINGNYYKIGGLSSSGCQSCQPLTSTSAWQNVSNGTLCQSGQYCYNGACTAGCNIQGRFYPSGSTNGTCQFCDPPSSKIDWTNVSNGISCGAGKVCKNGSCADQGITIAGKHP